MTDERRVTLLQRSPGELIELIGTLEASVARLRDERDSAIANADAEARLSAIYRAKLIDVEGRIEAEAIRRTPVQSIGGSIVNDLLFRAEQAERERDELRRHLDAAQGALVALARDDARQEGA